MKQSPATHQGRKFSLRYKLLLVLTLIPLLLLALYGAMALNLFKDDKIAYVFESSQSQAHTLELQTTSMLNSIFNLARPSLQEFATRSKFGPVAAGLFKVDSPISWMAIFEESKLRSGMGGILDQVEKKKGQFQSDWMQIGQEVLKRLDDRRGQVVLFPWSDANVALVDFVGNAGAEKLVVILADLPSLWSGFRQPGPQQNYLVRSSGEVLIQSAEASLDSWLESVGTDSIRKLFADSRQQGSVTWRGQKGEMLAAFSRVPVGDLAVVTMIPMQQALAAQEELLKRSLLFMLILVAATFMVSLMTSSSLTSSLVDLFRATQKVAEGDFDVRVKVQTHDEVGSLANSFNVMALEVKRLLLETAEKARMEGELKTAQTVQETLFPEPHNSVLGLNISGFYEPASECGGDWWHYSVVDGKVFLWIGDATGHGAPAALITSATKSASTVIEKMKVDPQTALTLLNMAIHDVSKGKIMMTFFLACFDPSSGRLTYSNASHEPPFLIRGGEKVSRKNLIPLNQVTSPRLGHSLASTYEQAEIQLQPGDRILFFTDGVPEILDPSRAPWGEREFLKAIVASNQNFPPVRESLHQLVNAWSEHRQGAQLADDVTLFICEYKGGAA